MDDENSQDPLLTGGVVHTKSEIEQQSSFNESQDVVHEHFLCAESGLELPGQSTDHPNAHGETNHTEMSIKEEFPSGRSNAVKVELIRGEPPEPKGSYFLCYFVTSDSFFL